MKRANRVNISTRWKASGRRWWNPQLVTEHAELQRERRLTTSKSLFGGLALVLATLAGVTVAYSDASSPAGCGEITATIEMDRSASGLWVMDADGSHQRRLTEGRGWGSAAWSPDSKQVASWNQPATGNPNKLLVVNVDGTGQRALTEGMAAEDVVWSPHESKIFFNVMRNEDAAQVWDRYAIKSDGSGLTLVLQGLDLHEPAASPDGTKVAFMGSDQQIYVMNADGSSRVRVTEGKNTSFSPAWRPDGSQIVYSSSNAGTDSLTSTGIEIANIDGSDRDLLTFERDMFYANPVWSPDGEWIAFDSYPHEDWGWLTVVRSDGTERHNVTSKLREPVTHDAAWSPDGTIIAFTDGNGIGVVASDGSQRTCLTGTVTGTHSHSPMWSPDGTKIAFFRS